MSAIRTIAVAGIGKVGSLVATLLHDTGLQVTGVDSRAHRNLPCPVEAADIADPSVVANMLEGKDAVVSCLPHHLNLKVAEAAHARGIHYFDLTEDVSATKTILEMSADARAVLAPQCGLAPGFIGIVGASLTNGFETLRSIRLRVGALPQHPSGLLGYAFIWSPEGVVNEYLNDCDVIKNGHKMVVPSMGQLEKIIVNGTRLEAFTTSGGLGTMCDTFEGRVEQLDYKTLRYPGHCEQMKFFFRELRMYENREQAGKILVNAKPPVNDDVVHVHAAVEGHKDGRLLREEFVSSYYPMAIAGRTWRAISWTTAASVCAVVEMVSNGTLAQSGFIKQEEIVLDDFLATRNGALYRSGSRESR